MNREIKFRAWDTEESEFVYPDLFWNASIPINWEKFYIPQQYTGLKDKNGKAIYEGDIVEYTEWRYTPNPKRGEIFYKDGAFLIGEEGDLLHTLYPTTRVIGNIYEHTHLLTPSKQ